MGFIRRNLPLVLLYAVFGSYFVFLFFRIFSLTPQGLFAGHNHVWSDWPLHMGMANIFASKPPSQWFAYHPYFSGGQFTYPFLTNLLPGVLARFGLPLAAAMSLSSAVYSLLLIGGLFALSRYLLRSAWQAALSVALFFCSSGWGFLAYLEECRMRGEIFRPWLDYSQLLGIHYYAGNVVKGFLAPQRGFLLGMAAGSWALYLLCSGLEMLQREQRHAVSRLFAAAVLIGILPITHIHTLFVLFPAVAALCLANFRLWRQLSFFAAVSLGMIAVLYFLFIAGGIQSANFFHYQPGWKSRHGLLGWLALWLQLFGLTIPSAVLGLFVLRRQEDSKTAQLVLWAAFVPFAAGNLLLTQPSEWDNSKLFFWCYFFFSCAAAHLVFFLGGMPSFFGKVLAVLLSTFLSATGVVELISLQNVGMRQLRVSTTAEMELGETIREQTAWNAIFVTAPVHNHFIMLWAARPVLLGFPGWVKNFGFDPLPRMMDEQRIYAGSRDTPELLQKYGASYVVVGPDERANYPDLNEGYFLCRYEIAFQNRTCRVYKVRNVVPGEACRETNRLAINGASSSDTAWHPPETGEQP